MMARNFTQMVQAGADRLARIDARLVGWCEARRTAVGLLRREQGLVGAAPVAESLVAPLADAIMDEVRARYPRHFAGHEG